MGKFFILPNVMVIPLYNFLQWIIDVQAIIIERLQDEIESGAELSGPLETSLEAYYDNCTLLDTIKKEITILTPVQLGHFGVLFDVWAKLYLLSDAVEYDDMVIFLSVARKLNQCIDVFQRSNE